MYSLISELIAGIENNVEEAYLGAGEVAAASHFGFGKYQALEPYNDRLATDAPAPEDVEALKSDLVAHIKCMPMPATSTL